MATMAQDVVRPGEEKKSRQGEEKNPARELQGRAKRQSTTYGIRGKREHNM